MLADMNSIVRFLSNSDILGLYGVSPLQPEKGLMLAVLQDSVECFQEYEGDEANHLFKNIKEWIFEDDYEWLFSFIKICEAVNMDPNYLRKGLLDWNTERSRKAISGSSRMHKRHSLKQQWATDLLTFSHLQSLTRVDSPLKHSTAQP
jgi:hypothetical protein